MMPAMPTGGIWLKRSTVAAAFIAIGFCCGVLFDKYMLPARGEVKTPEGRFRRTRTPAPGITKAQEAEIAKLRALGYLSGVHEAQGESGVTVYDRQVAYSGLNLVTDGHSPEAMLLDMEGRELHRWHVPYDVAFPNEDVPSSPATGYWRRVRLLDNGDLLAIFEGLGLIKVNRDSQLVWALSNGAHHDLEVRPDGSIYVLTRSAHMIPRVHSSLPILEDFVTVLDADGHEMMQVSILEAVENSEYWALFENRAREAGDIFHTNAIKVLDGSLANKIAAFKAGNVLISLANLNAIAVMELAPPKIVWALAGLWVHQHDPIVLENGNLMVFDNRGNAGRARVVEFDPRTQEIAWEYTGDNDDLQSDTCGANQRLPNGNVLITETDYGRALEVTAEKRIVWEYYTPHRSGKDNELIATLFDSVRLPLDVAKGWSPQGNRGK